MMGIAAVLMSVGGVGVGLAAAVGMVAPLVANLSSSGGANGWQPGWMASNMMQFALKVGAAGVGLMAIGLVLMMLPLVRR